MKKSNPSRKSSKKKSQMEVIEPQKVEEEEEKKDEPARMPLAPPVISHKPCSEKPSSKNLKTSKDPKLQIRPLNEIIPGARSQNSRTSKGQRWAFSKGLNQNINYTQEPVQSIKVKYDVTHITESNHFGDVYQIQLCESDPPKTCFLHSFNKTKQTNKEAKFFINQVKQFLSLKGTRCNVIMLEHLFRSDNNTFLMFEKP